MQKIQKTINVYDAGDVLDISKCYIAKCGKKITATKAIVLRSRELQGGCFSYSVITNETKMVVLRPAELGCERYIGHIDLSLLMEHAGSNERVDNTQSV